MLEEADGEGTAMTTDRRLTTPIMKIKPLAKKVLIPSPIKHYALT